MKEPKSLGRYQPHINDFQANLSVNLTARKYMPKIKRAKCKIISPSDQRIVIEGEEEEPVEEFVFPKSVVPKSAKYVIRRIGLSD